MTGGAMPYWNDDSVLAHMIALAAFRAFESMGLKPERISCGDCPYGHLLCGKGCPGEPEEPPDVRDVPVRKEA